jgi:preprotein translocase subunit YajC
MGLIAEAWAQGAAPGQGSPLVGLVLPLIMVAVLYLVLIRPQQKRAKEQRTMVEALKTGDEVVTSGGILGRITDVTDQFVTLEIAEGVQIRVQKYMIGALMPKGTVKGK